MLEEASEFRSQGERVVDGLGCRAPGQSLLLRGEEPVSELRQQRGGLLLAEDSER